MRRLSSFYKFYWGFVIAFAVLLFAGLFFLYRFLVLYESIQPVNVAQQICNDYVKPGKILELKDKYNLKLSDYETEENAKKALSGLIADKFEVISARSGESGAVPTGAGNKDVQTFTVKSGGKNIMRIVMSAENSNKNGLMTRYTVDEVALSDDLYKTATVTFPSSAQITVNGKEVSSDDVSSAPLPEIKGVDFGESAIHTCTLKITDLLNSDIVVKAGEGFIIQANETGVSVSQEFEDKFKKETEDFAVAGAKAYANYMQDNGSLGQISKYIDTSSSFYKNIRGTIVSFALSFNSSDFENLECTDFTKHSDTIYSCRVKFVHVLRSGAKVYRDNFDKRIYLRVDKSGKKIIDMQRIE